MKESTKDSGLTAVSNKNYKFSSFEYPERFFGNNCYQNWPVVGNKIAFNANLSQHHNINNISIVDSQLSVFGFPQRKTKCYLDTNHYL